MRCRIDITAATDVAAWVSRTSFMANVDLNDLACRDAENVSDLYHQNWFRRDDKNELYFTPPAFEFRDGYLRGINRHRAILLCRHLEVIPMLLVRPDTWPPDKLSEIMQAQIGDGVIIELPDFPIMASQ